MIRAAQEAQLIPVMSRSTEVGSVSSSGSGAIPEWVRVDMFFLRGPPVGVLGVGGRRDHPTARVASEADGLWGEVGFGGRDLTAMCDQTPGPEVEWMPSQMGRRAEQSQARCPPQPQPPFSACWACLATASSECLWLPQPQPDSSVLWAPCP